jgi:diacylglycerol O-acyltransferase / wax synthase
VRTVERLTSLEASFLALERPGLPMHVGAVVLLEAAAGRRPLTLDDVRTLMASRLTRLPRFRERVRFAPFGLRRPEWIPVARPDLSRHVFEHHLRAPGGRSQLLDLCARIQQKTLPRDLPLWQLHLVDGLEDGRQALIVKTHHAITDGVGAMELADVILERGKPGEHAAYKKLPVVHFACDDPNPSAWLEALVGVAFTAASGPIALASPFNAPVGQQRAFAMATLSMDGIRQVKRDVGVSVDDVLLATVARGLQRYFRRGGLAAPRAMRAMVPASTRLPSRKAQGGNHVTTVFIDLPLDARDLAACARRIAISKAMLKTVHAGLGMSLLIEAAGRLPTPLHNALVRLAGNLPVANLVLSDVPGPLEPRFFLGRRVVASYPMLPLPGAVGVSIAAISMGGAMGIGITCDPNLLPNPARLARAIEQELGAFVATLPRSEPRIEPVRVIRAA